MFVVRSFKKDLLMCEKGLRTFFSLLGFLKYIYIFIYLKTLNSEIQNTCKDHFVHLLHCIDGKLSKGSKDLSKFA